MGVLMDHIKNKCNEWVGQEQSENSFDSKSRLFGKKERDRFLKSVLGFLGDYFSDTHIQQLEENSHSGDNQKNFGSLNENPPEK